MDFYLMNVSISNSEQNNELSQVVRCIILMTVDKHEISRKL